MVGQNKNIVRSILIASYILIIALIISGVSALFGYVNTGADRAAMLHTEIKKVEQYLPSVEWAPLANEGRQMDDQNLKAIQNDYLDAWYVKHIAYNTNTKNGIEDYYTENARENLYLQIDDNRARNVKLESTTLKHNPTLEFFSEDGQLVVLTDHDVVEYKRVFKDENRVLEITETASYKIVMLLEDGFWRIRHLVKMNSKDYLGKVTAVAFKDLNIEGINYYPKASPWDMYGDKFSKDTISKDFKIIRDAGLNSVRLFVPYQDFGKAEVKAEKLEKLKHTLDAAEAHDLKAVITLFDFYGDYSVLDWTLNMRHAEIIINSFKNHKALLAWDIKNEPNLDFESRGKSNVVAWLENMINHVKSLDGTHPVTIGWSNTQSAPILKDKVDFISFHYYEDIYNLDKAVKALQKEIPNKTLVLQEFGISSYRGVWNPFGPSPEDQAVYHQKAQDIIAKNNLQFMSWTLYDFTEIPKEVVGRLPWRKNAQKHFGFLDSNGQKKKSFKYISGR